MAFAASKCPPHRISICSFIQSSALLRLYASIFFPPWFFHLREYDGNHQDKEKEVQLETK